MAKTDWDAVHKGYADAMEVVRTATNATDGYAALTDALAKRMPSDLWVAFRQIDIAADARHMRAFL